MRFRYKYPASVSPSAGEAPQTVAAQFHFRPGPAPSVAELQIASQVPGVADASGTLELDDGRNDSFSFTDCHAVDCTLEKTPAAWTCKLRVQDRRWRWAGKPLVTGEYNLRDMAGRICESGYTKKTASQLAAILLGSMNETGYTIDLPNDSTDEAQCPYVKWDKAAPAQALQELCDLYGRTLTLSLSDGNPVVIYGPGAAATAPEDLPSPVRSVQGTDYDPLPSRIRIVGAPRRFLLDFSPLNGVCLQPDGSIEQWSSGTLLAELAGTYYPGWHEELRARALLAASAADAQAWNLRAECVEKTFMHWYQPPDTVTIYYGGESESLPRQIYMRHWRLETNDYGTSETENKYVKGYVYGQFQTMDGAQDGIDEDDGEEDTAANRQHAPGEVALDSIRGVVRFSKPICDINATTGRIFTPTIKLRAVLEYQPSEYVADSGLAGSIGSYFYSEVHEDFQYCYDNTTANGTPTNQAVMDALAEAYAAQAAEKLGSRTTSTRTETYSGLIPFACDGVVQEVTWSVGVDEAPYTVVSYNRTHSLQSDTAQRSLQRKTYTAWRKFQEEQNRRWRTQNEVGGDTSD